jgi:hypothetical protein
MKLVPNHPVVTRMSSSLKVARRLVEASSVPGWGLQRIAYRGVSGEGHLDRALFELRQDGVRILHAVETRHGVIDRILAGPTGVFVLQTPYWQGTVARKDERLVAGGEPHDALLERARVEARETKRRLLDGAGYDLWVEAVVIPMGASVAGRQLTFPPVTVLGAMDLISFVRAGTARLDDRQIVRATKAILEKDVPDAVADPFEELEQAQALDHVLVGAQAEEVASSTTGAFGWPDHSRIWASISAVESNRAGS